jgi:hypothetical protein
LAIVALVVMYRKSSISRTSTPGWYISTVSKAQNSSYVKNAGMNSARTLGLCRVFHRRGTYGLSGRRRRTASTTSQPELKSCEFAANA